jgi:hypothetical protein
MGGITSCNGQSPLPEYSEAAKVDPSARVDALGLSAVQVPLHFRVAPVR